MIYYDKEKVRQSLTFDNIFTLLEDFGGNPEKTSFGILSSTICHHKPEEKSSRKLYYYENTGLFRCYTDCGEFFDPFDLVIKVMKIQKNKEITLMQAIKFLIYKFNILNAEEVKTEIDNESEEWKIFEEYNRIKEIKSSNVLQIELEEYDKDILKNLNYDVKLTPWLKEEILQSVIDSNNIGYFPATNQITIPHYDIKGRFIGLRGRSLSKEESEIYGKYRPMIINKKMYNHPLGLNLYNLNNAKNNIKKFKKAVVFESEKSTLKGQGYFGSENDIYVACCGSNLTNYQAQMLLECGAREICIAFDRQFQEIGDSEFIHLKNNLMKIYNKFHKDAVISFIFDKRMITAYKASPIDEGKDKFLKLFKERIIL